MTRKGRYIIILLVLSLILGVTAGCRRNGQEVAEQPPNIGEDLEDENETEGKGGNSIDSNGKEDNENEKPSSTKPNILLEDKQGNKVSIYGDGNKLLILTFWVEWSQESKEQLMILENIYPLLKDEAHFFGIHGTGFDTLTKNEVIERIEDMSLPYPLLIDKESEAQQAFFIGAFPTTVIVDTEGNVLLSLTSLVKEDQLLDEIEMILEGFLP